MLRPLLRHRNNELLQTAEAIINTVTPLLWHSIATFPSGTSHTPEHTHQVEQIANELIPEELAQNLNDDEIQLLILACHFHDLGMVGSELDNASEESRDQVRRDHAIRVGTDLTKQWKTLGFPNRDLAQALSEICRGHRPQKIMGEANWDDLAQYHILAPKRTVRIRLVSALIYAADELHLGADRAPEREEDWLEINEEARRHWKRHQSITGPAFLNGSLCYDVSPATAVCEVDLRLVLQKALTAVSAANEEINRHGIECKLVPITIRWKRQRLLELALIKVLSDHCPRSHDEIVEAVAARNAEQLENAISLDENCNEEATSDDERSRLVERVVRDFITRGLLAEVDGKYSFDVSNAAHQFFRPIVRDADEIDVLFEGPYARRHEFDFLRSPYGQAYNNQCLQPLVKMTFGVDLAHEETSVKHVLAASPSASKIVTELPPGPSVLVKRELLRTCAMTGAAIDMLRHPNLMLKSEFRNAVHSLSRQVSSHLENQVEFAEELALIGELSLQEVFESAAPTEAAKESLSDNESTTEFRLTQTFSLKYPITSVSFTHLHLAATRCGTGLEILSTPEAPLVLKDEIVEEAELAKIAFSPCRSPFGCGDMRGALSICEESRSICVTSNMETRWDQSLPVIVSLSRDSADANIEVKLNFHHPTMTAKDYECLSKMDELIDSGGCQLKMVIDGHEMSSPLASQHAQAFRFVKDRNVIKALLNCGLTTPFPWFTSDGDAKRIHDSPSSLEELFLEYAEKTEKEIITTITIRLASYEGDYREIFLGFFESVRFTAPTVTCDSVKETEQSQSQINSQWEQGGVTVCSWFATDIENLLKELQAWASKVKSGESVKFPFNFDAGNSGAPVIRSCLEFICEEKIDRHWYREHPITIRLRPATQLESWSVERQYWQSKNDTERVKLLEDRLQRKQTSQRGDTQPSDSREDVTQIDQN